MEVIWLPNGKGSFDTCCELCSATMASMMSNVKGAGPLSNDPFSLKATFEFESLTSLDL